MSCVAVPLKTAGMPKRRYAERKSLPTHAKAILCKWLWEHQHNPYPTEEKKAYLMAATQLTWTQISNWFINGRRRLIPKWQGSVTPPSSEDESRSHRARRRPKRPGHDASGPELENSSEGLPDACLDWNLQLLADVCEALDPGSSSSRFLMLSRIALALERDSFQASGRESSNPPIKVP